MQLSPGFLSRGFGGKFPAPHVVDVASRQRPPCRRRAAAAGRARAGRGDAGPRGRRQAAGLARLRFPDHGRRLPERPHPHGLRAAGGRRPPRRRQRPCHSRRPGAGAAGPPDALRAGRAQDGRRRGRQRHRPHGLARRPAGLRGAHRDPRSRPFAGRRFLAFAGIGDPEKFFDTVAEAGGDGRNDAAALPTIISSPRTISTICRRPPREKGLELVTTAKDAVRLRHGASHERAFAAGLDVLEIELVFDFRDPARHHRRHAQGMAPPPSRGQEREAAADRSDA